jgi:hypothetical protein
MRRLVAMGVVVALGSAAGCGEEETEFSDDSIVQALGLERADDAPVFEVGGDPFCQVEEELLNDPVEVEEAEAAKNALPIADSTASVGIQVVPPFDPACEDRARKDLNKLYKSQEE